MGIAKVVFGKADYRYFVDLVCDGKHDGPCGSQLNKNCSSRNLLCGAPYRECKKVAKEAAAKYGVPLETDWD
ncbi:MAG: hypothetical protein HFG00_02830 [Oscillibacter sp.]|nr:hypothetical protein [Oscillibacter sp.]